MDEPVAAQPVADPPGASVTQAAASPAACRDIAIAGARHLARIVDDEGRFAYEIDLATGQPRRAYNIVRHCGCVWAMLEVYQDGHDHLVLEAAERALLFMERRVQRFGAARVVVDRNTISIGSIALGVLALLKHRAVTGDRHREGLVHGLADYLLMNIADSGELVYHVRNLAEPSLDEKRIIYFPGETVLALAVAARDLEAPHYRQAALRIVDHLASTRDSGRPAQDHWLLQAFEVLGAAHLPYAGRLAMEMVMHPGYLKNRRSTPIACRSEALVSYLHLTDDMPVERFLLELLERQRGYQLTEGPFAGAFVSREDDPILRNDYTQHNICAFIRYWRLRGG